MNPQDYVRSKITVYKTFNQKKEVMDKGRCLMIVQSKRRVASIVTQATSGSNKSESVSINVN